MDRRTVYRRCLPGGPWRWLLPGIIMLQNAEPTHEQRLIAALLYGGPNAVITGLDACQRQGLNVGEREVSAHGDKIHLLIPHAHRIKSSGFVLVERTLRMPKARHIRDVPVTPVTRAALDAARRMRADEPVANLLFEAARHGGCSRELLREELDVGGQRGTAIPRRILGETRHLRSVAELDAKRLVAATARPPTHWNPRLFTANGRYVATPDAWWDDVGLAWEIDSAAFHYSRDAFNRTVNRNSRYGRSSVPVVCTLPSELRSNPDGVLRSLDEAYHEAAARTRPDVRIVCDGEQGPALRE